MGRTIPIRQKQRPFNVPLETQSANVYSNYTAKLKVKLKAEALRKRYFSENGRVKNVSLYWGSDPSRAASALLAVILRHKLGYQNIRLQQGLHNLRDFAADVPHNATRKYDEMILAISVAWEPSQIQKWLPNAGAMSGLAGPRLVEFGASSVPVRHRLYVYLAQNFSDTEECKNTTRWRFYTNENDFKRCGFVLRDDLAKNALLYGLNSGKSIMKELLVRTKEHKLLLQFQNINRTELFHLLRTSKHSFLFVDYDMWSGHPSIRTVQIPPCITDASNTCQQELDTALAMRVGDVFLLEEYTPHLFQAVYNFTPSPETVLKILKLESQGIHIEQAACVWASQHDTMVKTWVGDYRPSDKIYELAAFYCGDDPDYHNYDKLLGLLGFDIIPNLYKSFKVRFRRYKTDCSDANFVKSKIENYMSVAVRQRLIGALVGGVKNVTDVIKTVDGSRLPVMFYDAVGVDADSTTSTWLTSGRALHLALALKHFILSMNWTRVAVLSERSATAKRIFDDLNEVGGFSLGNHLVPFNLSQSDAEEILEKLKTEDAYIVFINTNYKIASTILSAATKLEMNSDKDYAWIVREWRPNRRTRNIKHFTLTFSSFCGKDVGNENSEGLLQLRQQMDNQKEWRNCTWPAQAATLADAVLALLHGFNSIILKNPQIRDDVHSEEAIRLFERSLIDDPIQGISQNMSFKGHSLDDPLVFINEWQGDWHENLARWRVNATSRTVQVENMRRAVYPLDDPPDDGTSGCIAYSGDTYMPTCYDGLWGTALIFLVLAPPSILLAYRVIRRRIKEHQKKLICELLAQRQQRAAALSAGYLVDRSTLSLRQELGSGRFGLVRLAELRVPGRAPRYVAAKALRDNQDESEILREACTLASLNHDHIVRLVGVCIDKDPPLVLMEVAFFGDLLQYLRARRYLAEGVASDLSASNLASLDKGEEEANHVSAEALTRLARQAASALGYLSLRGVIHRDLRASNCLVDASRSLKLADFGLAREPVATGLDGGAEYACRRRGLFPVLWMAPESLVHGVFSTASDVWALGVLVFELVTLGARPFGDMSPLRVMQFVAAGGKPPMPRDATPQTIGLARLCWQREAEQRPTAADVVAYLAERPCSLRPALDCDHDPADADSGFGESPMSELLPC